MHGQQFYTLQHNFYQVFMFAREADAEIFCKAFDGERMHRSEKG